MRGLKKRIWIVFVEGCDKWGNYQGLEGIKLKKTGCFIVGKQNFWNIYERKLYKIRKTLRIVATYPQGKTYPQEKIAR